MENVFEPTGAMLDAALKVEQAIEEKEINEGLQAAKSKLKQITNKWSKTPYLNGFDDKEKPTIAVILENQEKMLAGQHMEPYFASNVFSLIQKVFTNFLPLNLIGCQPMCGPSGFLYHLRVKWDNPISYERLEDQSLWQEYREEHQHNNELTLCLETEKISAGTRQLPIHPITASRMENLDQLADDIRKAITSEILTDIRNNVATVATLNLNAFEHEERPTQLKLKLLEISNVIHRKTLRHPANWIVAGDKAIEELIGRNVSKLNRVAYFGKYHHRYRLWYNPDSPANEILMGFGGDTHFDHGYFYNPYIFASTAFLGADPDPSYILLTRYSKKLLRDGAKYYAKLNLHCEEGVGQDAN